MLIRPPRDVTNIAKWMTLPAQSGNMSQLYRGFSWISMKANLAGATIVASICLNLTPSRTILQAPERHFPALNQ
jgi:hypothetical protein